MYVNEKEITEKIAEVNESFNNIKDFIAMESKIKDVEEAYLEYCLSEDDEDEDDDILNSHINWGYLTENPININLETLQIKPYGQFTKQWYGADLRASHFKKFKSRLKINPNDGWVIPKGSDGVSVPARVSEISIPQEGNVIRVVYTYIASVNTLFCIMVYSHIDIGDIKGKKDLTNQDKKKLNDIIKELNLKYPKGGTGYGTTK